MKRIIAWLLLLCMLIACQPTPDHEFVVNKGDDLVEEKLNATPKPAAPEDTVDVPAGSDGSAAPDTTPKPAVLAKQTFPERWEEAAAKVSEHLSISVNAEILQREDGLYPGVSHARHGDDKGACGRDRLGDPAEARGRLHAGADQGGL